MKLTRWIFPLLLIGAPLLPAAEPAVFPVMLRGYCYAGSSQTDTNAPGGFGKSDNLPKRLPSAPTAADLYLELVESPEVVFAQKYTGLRVRLVNGAKKTVALYACDSRLSLVQEAQDTDGTWKEIEYLPNSWCGNSYHHVYLPSQHYWEFIAPHYAGPQKTKLRFKLTIEQDRIIYSPAYEGGVHPGQFTDKAGHQPANLMDPYNE